MGAFIGSPTWYVRRAGDTMSGPLSISAGDLVIAVGNLGLTNGSIMAYAGNLNLGGNIAMYAGSTVDGIDVSEIHQAKVKTGTYTGNGADDRDINIGVNLAAKNNVNVIIQGTTGQVSAWRHELGQGDLSCRINSNEIADMIQTLTATGFQVGTRLEVNQVDIIYHYLAIWEEP